MLIFSKALEFLWAKAIATTCFTQNRSIVHTRHNKNIYELIRGRKPNVQYFHVFDGLTAMASEYNNLEPGLNCENFNDSLEDSQFDDAPIIVVSSKEQVVTEPNSSVLNEVANEFVQEDVADFDLNMFHNLPQTPEFDVAESYSTYQDPSNMHQFHHRHCSTNRWTKNHPLEQVISDPSKPVTIRKRLQTDAEVCMYALTVSTIEPKNIKEAMLDLSWIESMQDKLNQFKRLDVWEFVECPIGINIIKVKWIWKIKLMLRTQLFGTSLV
nr:Gag-Pol polyprotein [Tanacetum cinerariifolium]